MNLFEKMSAAEKAAKANLEAQAEAEKKNRDQQKAKHDELMARIFPAAEALKRFIEGAEGLAIRRFLKQTGGQIFLDYRNPTGLASLAFLKYSVTETYLLSGEGLWVEVSYYWEPDSAPFRHKKVKTRRARRSDYVNLSKCRALKGKDPFCLIEEIKAEASKRADSLLGSNTRYRPTHK